MVKDITTTFVPRPVAVGLLIAATTALLLFAGLPAGADVAAESYGVIYTSSSSNGSAGSVSFADEDIVAWDTTTDVWSKHLDGSDVGLANYDLNGFHILDPSIPLSPILMTFQQEATIPDLGLVDDSDIVLFTPTSLGEVSNGTFTMYLDGSTMSLTTNNEDIDAIAFAPDGRLVISTIGSPNLPATGGGTVAGRDEDLFIHNVDDTFELYLDGSDVSFSTDLGSAWIHPRTNEVFGTNTGAWDIDGLVGDGDDMLLFVGTFGPTTTGAFSTFFDGDEHDIGGEQLDALFIDFFPLADLSVTVTDDVDPLAAEDPLTLTVEISNAGPDDAEDVVATVTLPAGLEAAGLTGCAEDPDGLVCSLGALPASTSASFTVDVSIDADRYGVVTSTARAATSTIDPEATNNTGSETTTITWNPAAADDEAQTDIDTTLGAGNLLSNDDLGVPDAAVASFGGGDLGGAADDNAADATVAVGDGELSVNADGSFTFTPDTGFSGIFTFDYRITNVSGSSDATMEIRVGPEQLSDRDAVVHVSSETAGEVGGVEFEDEDIISYDFESDTWSMFFDGSDLGLESRDLSGFHIVDPEAPLPTILFTLANPMNVPGFGPADDSDILEFTPSSLGDTTSGTLALHLDGSAVGLTTWDEDIDAIARAADGRTIISTVGESSVPAVGGASLTAQEQDLLVLNSDGTFELLFDGSELDANITGAWLDTETDSIHASFRRGLTTAGVSGDADDVHVFPLATGQEVELQGTLFDGDDHEFGSEQIDGLQVSYGDTVTVPTEEPTITSDGGGAQGWITIEENRGAPGTVIWGGGAFTSTQPLLSSAEVVDDSGNVYSTGFFQGTVDFDPGAGLEERTSAGGFDLFVSKLDDAGDHVWTVVLGDTGDDRGAGVAVGDTGDVYVTGYFQGTVDFDPGAGVDELTASGVEDVFVARLTAAGDLVWVQGMGGSDDVAGSGVAVDETGTLISIDDFVTDVQASDPGGETEAGGGITYSFTSTIDGADNAAFNLDADTGLVGFATPPDFESPADANGDNDYEVEVTATNSGGLTDTQTLTVRVSDAED